MADDPTEQQIIKRESGGHPFIGAGGADLSNAPLDATGFPIWDGIVARRPEDAAKGLREYSAGLHQITRDNWHHYAPLAGVSDFSEASQHKVYDLMRFTEGARPWRTSAPGAGMQAEGEYGGAMHVNVRPQSDRDVDPEMLLGMLMAGPAAVPQQSMPEEKPDQLLDALLSGPAGGRQAQGSGAGSSTSPITVPAPVAPAQPAANIIPQGDVPTSPIRPPEQTLDALLAGSTPMGAASQFVKGLGEGVYESGEHLKSSLPSMTKPEGLGAAVGRVPGGMIESALGTATRAGEAATGEGPPLDPQEALNTALLGVGSSVGKTGLGAGPRLQGLIRTPTQQAARAAYVADKDEAMASLRAESGTARRRKAEDEAELEQFRKGISGEVPDFQRFVAETHAGNPSPAPSSIMDMIDHIEGVSTLPANHPLTGAADTLREIAERVKGDIQREIPGMPFIDDYFRHLWADKGPAASADRPVGRQGSGASLRQRTIPTVGAGIRAGLTPKYLDPVENMLRYVQGMEDYLAMHRAFNAGRDAGYVQYHAPGSEPDGWVQLKGRWSETSPKDTRIVMHAYAPPGYAAAWNAYFGQGFRATEWGRAIYDGILAAKNTMTAALFALSGYHPLAMMQESEASALALSAGHLLEGEQNEALKQLGLGAIIGVRAGKDTFGLGKKVEQQYLRQKDYGPEMAEVVDLYERAGGRATGRGAEWSGSQGENFFKAWRRGRLKAGLAERFSDATKGRAPVTAGLRMLGQVSEEMARVMETVTSPLFDKAIPRLKNAAFHDEMAAWLNSHPTATHPEKLAAARHFVDLMDDRFGEMIMDNVFWNKAAKQTLQIMSVSLGWELGSIRSMGKALPDLLRGNPARVRYLAGLGTAIMLENAAYQYLLGSHTAPSSPTDLLFPQTGGKTPEGKTERALLPGFQKDFVGYWHNPAGEFFNKLSFAGRLPMEAVTGKDRYGHDIAPFPQYTPSWFRAWGKHVLDQMTPIPLQQDRLKGSNIGGIQSAAGIRPAPAYVTDQARTDAIETTGRIRALQGEARGLAAHGARTTGDRQELQNKLRIIDGEIRGLQQGLQQRQRDRRPETMQ